MSNEIRDDLCHNSKIIKFSSSSVHFWSNSSNSLQNIFRSFKSTSTKKFGNLTQNNTNYNEHQNKRAGSCENTRKVLTTKFPVNKYDNFWLFLFYNN